MNIFNRKSTLAPPSPSPLRRTTSGPEAFQSNSAYGRGFFEPGAYSNALKRCENGHDLAQKLGDMFDERAQIESDYADKLRAWSRKWNSELDKSQEYGTNKTVWIQAANTGEQISDVHAEVSKALTESLIPKLRQWRKDHYEKTMLHYKKTKEFEKEFMDAQKSWNKLLGKIEESKAAYYSACKASKAADNAERACTNDQRKKLADKADVARREIDSAKTKYQQAINQSIQQQQAYKSDMATVFQKTQAFERKRMDAFAQTFDEYATILKAATLDNPKFTKMIDDFNSSLSTHNPEQDLLWWDQNYGTQTNSRWPEYEEYKD